MTLAGRRDKTKPLGKIFSRGFVRLNYYRFEIMIDLNKIKNKIEKLYIFLLTLIKYRVKINDVARQKTTKKLLLFRV